MTHTARRLAGLLFFLFAFGANTASAQVILEIYEREAFHQWSNNSHFGSRLTNVQTGEVIQLSLEGFADVHNNASLSETGRPYQVVHTAYMTPAAGDAYIAAYRQYTDRAGPYALGESNAAQHNAITAANYYGAYIPPIHDLSREGRGVLGYNIPAPINTGNAVIDWTANAGRSVVFSAISATTEIITRIGNGIATAWNWFTSLFNGNETTVTNQASAVGYNMSAYFGSPPGSYGYHSDHYAHNYFGYGGYFGGYNGMFGADYFLFLYYGGCPPYYGWCQY